MTPEGRVKARVNKALKALGADVWRFMPVQSGYGTAALDYLLCIRGRFVAIETKAPGNKLTPMQEGTKAQMEAAGGIVLVVSDDSSLAIAMKIILALEFAPYGTSRSNAETVREGLSAAETPWARQQHVSKWVAHKTIDAAAGGDIGAPGEPSEGCAEPSPRGEDQ